MNMRCDGKHIEIVLGADRYSLRTVALRIEKYWHVDFAQIRLLHSQLQSDSLLLESRISRMEQNLCRMLSGIEQGTVHIRPDNRRGTRCYAQDAAYRKLKDRIRNPLSAPEFKIPHFAQTEILDKSIRTRNDVQVVESGPIGKVRYTERTHSPRSTIPRERNLFQFLHMHRRRNFRECIIPNCVTPQECLFGYVLLKWRNRFLRFNMSKLETDELFRCRELPVRRGERAQSSAACASTNHVATPYCSARPRSKRCAGN